MMRALTLAFRKISKGGAPTNENAVAEKAENDISDATNTKDKNADDALQIAPREMTDEQYLAWKGFHSLEEFMYKYDVEEPQFVIPSFLLLPSLTRSIPP